MNHVSITSFSTHKSFKIRPCGLYLDIGHFLSIPGRSKNVQWKGLGQGPFPVHFWTSKERPGTVEGNFRALDEFWTRFVLSVLSGCNPVFLSNVSIWLLENCLIIHWPEWKPVGQLGSSSRLICHSKKNPPKSSIYM